MALVWSIISTDRETTNNGIMMAHWSASDSEDVGDETYYGNSFGTCSFVPDHTAGSFVAYASLTEADVIAWVKTALGADNIANTEAAVAAQIAESKTPSSVSGVPW